MLRLVNKCPEKFFICNSLYTFGKVFLIAPWREPKQLMIIYFFMKCEICHSFEADSKCALCSRSICEECEKEQCSFCLNVVCKDCDGIKECESCENLICEKCILESEKNPISEFPICATCEFCHSLLCRKCMKICSGCEKIFCEDHVSLCEICELNRFCEECSLSCERCGKYVCQDCSEEKSEYLDEEPTVLCKACYEELL